MEKAETVKNVIILSGASGSGKSTFAQFLSQNIEDCAIVSADDYFMKDGEYKFDQRKLPQAHEHCRMLFVQCLDFGIGTIIVDNTNTSQKEYQFYVDEAERYWYKVTRIIVDNINGTKSIHNVPEHVLERQLEKLRNSI